MSTNAAPQRQTIEAIVGEDRARFDTRERRIYSHDTAVLPSAFRLLAGPSLADGVAQPETEEQVARLVRYAATEGIPIVPRGKASSGYGGVVPAQGGLVLDLTRLKGIVWANPCSPKTSSPRASSRPVATFTKSPALNSRPYPKRRERRASSPK